jgi:hypothetical protein
MSALANLKPNTVCKGDVEWAAVARAFAFPFYYYFGRSGRLPHAGWKGKA